MELPAHSISAEQLEKLREFTWGATYDYVDPEAGIPIVQTMGYTLPMNFINYLEKLRNYPVDATDVFVNSFPKSGTTWMQHIVWYICTQDFSTEESIDWRFPNLEIPVPYPPKPENLDLYAARPPPRLCKTHVPVEFLPKQIWNAKVIYCYRNPKDTCVSAFHHCRAMVPHCYSGTFDQFANLFISGKLVFSPWHKHVLGYYEAMKSGKQVLMVAFEDMKKDRMGVIRRVADFIGKKLPEEMLQKICDATSFEAMKNNETGNYDWVKQMGFWDNNLQPFMRKGVVGDWKNHFTPERQKEFDEYFKKHFANVDLKFSDTQ